MKSARRSINEGQLAGKSVSRQGIYRETRGLIVALIRRVRRWQRLAYERRLLGTLDQHQLRDIGISRAEAARESARPCWDDAGLEAKRREM